MDNEIKDMLFKLLEGQNRLESRVIGLETEARKHSITLETIDGNIRTIAEWS